jgi:hypothetical protein
MASRKTYPAKIRAQPGWKRTRTAPNSPQGARTRSCGLGHDTRLLAFLSGEKRFTVYGALGPDTLRRPASEAERMKGVSMAPDEGGKVGLEEETGPTRDTRSAAILVLATTALVVGVVGFVVAIAAGIARAAIHFSGRGR